MSLNPFFDSCIVVSLSVFGDEWIYHQLASDWAIENLVVGSWLISNLSLHI